VSLFRAFFIFWLCFVARPTLAAEIGQKSGRVVPVGSAPVAASGQPSGATSGAASGAKAKANGVGAKVRTDGAMVFAKPDFDSDVLTTLKEGDKVRVSIGTTGEKANFHKVRAGTILGWIAEIDVQVDDAPKKREQRRGAGKRDNKNTKITEKKSSNLNKPKKPFMDDSVPMFFQKYVGAVVGLSDFDESISGVDAHESLVFYGLKLTGPDILFNGPVLDVNLLLHYGAPSYYNSLSTTKPSGFIFTADALLLYPFFNRDKGIVAMGLGPLLKLTSFNVTNGGDLKSLTEFDAGVSLALSGAMKFNKIAVRLEGKYLIEKHSEKLFQIAIQQQY
jgi:hypothetical protein